MEKTISPEIFIYFFIYSDPNLTQTQVFTLQLPPSLSLKLTQILILTSKKQMKNERFPTQ